MLEKQQQLTLYICSRIVNSLQNVYLKLQSIPVMVDHPRKTCGSLSGCSLGNEKQDGQQALIVVATWPRTGHIVADNVLKLN